jgi:tetrapyrrole methylase family protein/MazG family protein
MDFEQKEHYQMDDLRQIMTILRSDNGCPWDKEQDHHSIRKNFLEETYEVLEAIDEENPDLLQEELGDVLLQIVFHAKMEEEVGHFTFDDVVTGICQKLIHRHPHIFSDVKADTADKVLQNWDAIKKEEKNQKSYTETLENVPKVLPALMRSEKVQHRAKRAGMDFPDVNAAIAQLESEIEELKAAIKEENHTNIEEEIGDVLFSCVNISRFFGIDSEKSLTNSTEKFINRFRKVEQQALSEGIDMPEADWKTLDTLWKCVKNNEK